MSLDTEKTGTELSFRKKIEDFIAKEPLIVFEWKDSETEAKGWLVIHSLREGAAGGGTRMREGLDREEVMSLAKTMEVKFSIVGPPIGGAKSGINFSPYDPRKEGVLRRWFQAIHPVLSHYYGTGGDLNVDELTEVIPITQSQGLSHPQAGIVRGHFQAVSTVEHEKIQRLQRGVSHILQSSAYTPLREKYALADLITGYGVAEALRHYYQLWRKESLKGKRAIIQGWGNVGAAAAFYLWKEGVKIVAVIDKTGGVIDQKGVDAKALLLSRKDNLLDCKEKRSFEEINEKIWDTEAEIFVPAASSKLVSQAQCDKLISQGLEVISCGANVPFQEEAVFYGKTTQYVDEKVALLPDFIANSAMARVFAYLMSEESKGRVDENTLFSDVSACIYQALQSIHTLTPNRRLLTQHALAHALQILQ